VLTELEKRQGQQEEEIKKWEQSLQEVEEDVKKCEAALQTNMHTVGDWVRKIEERVAKLPGGEATS
jgi:nuclear migration protein JNM1